MPHIDGQPDLEKAAGGNIHRSQKQALDAIAMRL